MQIAGKAEKLSSCREVEIGENPPEIQGAIYSTRT